MYFQVDIDTVCIAKLLFKAYIHVSKLMFPTTFQLSYLNLGADTEEECDEIEVIVDDGHQRVSALLKGASLE